MLRVELSRRPLRGCGFGPEPVAREDRLVTGEAGEAGILRQYCIFRSPGAWGSGCETKNAAWLALLRTALLWPLLRYGWGTTREVFERVAARPGQGLELLAKRSFP